MTSAPANAATLTHTPVLTKLDSPWGLAFLPNGTFFFTGKCLGLSVRQNNGSVNKLLGMQDSKGQASRASDQPFGGPGAPQQRPVALRPEPTMACRRARSPAPSWAVRSRRAGTAR